jgi:hypothetical protein
VWDRTAAEGVLTRVEGTALEDGGDLRRSGDDLAEYDQDPGARAAFDAMDRIGPGVFWHPRPGGHDERT